MLRRLGQGGEGEIFVARDERGRRDVAVKTQFARTFESTTAYASAALPLEDELGRLRPMSNVPGIPEVLGDGYYGRSKRRYIVMELVDGVTIASWIIEHQPVPAAAAVSVVAQLCEILDGVHARGYVHRDVSPNNVMLQPDGRVRLLDVGISTGAGDINEDPRGTPGYAPPEQYDRTAEMTPQVDVFSLGALLFAMVVSRLPYSDLEGRPDSTTPAFPHDFRAEMPETLRSLALAMVSVDPRERPDGMTEVLRNLRPMLPTPGSAASSKATRPDPTTRYRLGSPLP
ncbi:serine/threonine-protein kinase [Streptosporangium sp. NPDC051022]|uniref:serine/threonine-protein kinase n=1 Tax=Streptosporangium sp. NPDC051022 TaxID=3155752 RepID=UPI00343885B2